MTETYGQRAWALLLYAFTCARWSVVLLCINEHKLLRHYQQVRVLQWSNADIYYLYFSYWQHDSIWVPWMFHYYGWWPTVECSHYFKINHTFYFLFFYVAPQEGTQGFKMPLHRPTITAATFIFFSSHIIAINKIQACFLPSKQRTWWTCPSLFYPGDSGHCPCCHDPGIKQDVPLEISITRNCDCNLRSDVKTSVED